MKRVVTPYRADRCASQIRDVCDFYNMVKKPAENLLVAIRDNLEVNA
jgi:hypothetical protein